MEDAWEKAEPEERKILLNSKYGGFGFSKAFVEYAAKHGRTIERHGYRWRCDQEIVALAEAFGLEAASDFLCEMYVETIPPYCTCVVDEYDGSESLVIHKPWGEMLAALADGHDHPVFALYREGAIGREFFEVPPGAKLAASQFSRGWHKN